MTAFEVEFEFCRRKKSHELIRWVWWLRNHWNSFFGQNFIQEDGSVTRSIVVMWHSSVRNLWPDTMNLSNSNSSHYWSFWLWNVDRHHEIPRFLQIFVRFWRARSSRMGFVFHTLTAIQKCFMPPKNLCPWYSMNYISPFQYFVNFCCVFIKFDTKFDGETLLEISFLHFRNSSLLHTLTQLAVKSDMLMLSSWHLHWSSSKNVYLGWCLRCGYSVASCRATHSGSLLSWLTTYVFPTYNNWKMFPLHGFECDQCILGSINT